MRGRHKVSRKGSRKMFSKTASRTHVRNVHQYPMRGGIRF
nr:MAG: DNA binding protein [Microviridae sp.]